MRRETKKSSIGSAGESEWTPIGSSREASRRRAAKAFGLAWAEELDLLFAHSEQAKTGDQHSPRAWVEARKMSQAARPRPRHYPATAVEANRQERDQPSVLQHDEHWSRFGGKSRRLSYQLQHHDADVLELWQDPPAEQQGGHDGSEV